MPLPIYSAFGAGWAVWNTGTHVASQFGVFRVLKTVLFIFMHYKLSFPLSKVLANSI
jgi:hypothetical protein